MNFRTIADLDLAIRRRLKEVPADTDLVIGIPRSGMLPAGLLSTYLNVPLIDVDGFVSGRTPYTGHRPTSHSSEPLPRTVLVVDDSTASGRQIQIARKALEEAAPNTRFFFVAVFGLDNSSGHCDLVCEVVKAPRIFSWNVVNSWVAERACVDIDGLLCPDPTPEENDDGDRYRAFLASTPALYQCEYEIAHLVTARLAKYRTETVDWLKQHGIRFRNLHMIDLPTAAARSAKGPHFHAKHKARIYSSINDTILFLESSRWQSKLISEMSGKPVFSAETGSCFYPSRSAIRWQQLRFYARHPRAAAGLVKRRLLRRTH